MHTYYSTSFFPPSLCQFKKFQVISPKHMYIWAVLNELIL